MQSCTLVMHYFVVKGHVCLVQVMFHRLDILKKDTKRWN